MAHSAGIHADYMDLRRVGGLLLNQEDEEGKNLLNDAVQERVAYEGILGWEPEALDSYDILETSENVPWVGLIKRLLSHAYLPFSSHSGAMFTLDWVHADFRREEFGLLLRGRDPETGGEDYVVVWDTDEGNTRVLTQRANIHMIATILELERRAEKQEA